MNVDLSTVGIDPSIPEHRALLANLQGNILKPHGREFVRLVLLRFTAHPDEVKRWIAGFARERVTSALGQFEDTERFRGREGGAEPTGAAPVFTMALSAKGYRYLGFDLGAFHESPVPERKVNTPFANGMVGAAGVLRDPPAGTWQEEYQGPIHLLLLLAHEHDDTLHRLAGQAEDSLLGIAEVSTETGRRMRRNGQDIEHFGFADGLSQPLFFTADLVGPIDQWDPRAPLSLVLAPDPFAQAGAHGSYLVYRKLQQNVEDFKGAIDELARGLVLSPDYLAAQAVGRFRDGTPVLRWPVATGDAASNFNYSGDDNGHRCPIHAHIRKMNPRGDTFRAGLAEDLESERRHRIVRRGVPYGTADDAERGLLFLCYQSDISTQFSHLQSAWAGDQDFVYEGRSGVDPITGRLGTVRQTWQKVWGDPLAPIATAPLQNFVTLRGGEFFFAPSLPFLRSLA